MSGGFWGSLIGLIFLNPLLGLAAGAGAGALSGALTDVGINDDFMKNLAATFKNGSSLLFVLVRKSTPDKVLAEIQGTGGKVIKTSLTHEQEQKCRRRSMARSGQRGLEPLKRHVARAKAGTSCCWRISRARTGRVMTRSEGHIGPCRAGPRRAPLEVGMTSPENIQMDRYNSELEDDIRHILKKYSRIMGWGHTRAGRGRRPTADSRGDAPGAREGRERIGRVLPR